MKNALLADKALALGAVHPAIRRHDGTGRDALYFGRVGRNKVVGLDEAEGKALLEALETAATRPEFVYRHNWTPGDFAVWDNRSTMHRRDSFPQHLRRVMYRCQVYAGRDAA